MPAAADAAIWPSHNRENKPATATRNAPVRRRRTRDLVSSAQHARRAEEQCPHDATDDGDVTDRQGVVGDAERVQQVRVEEIQEHAACEWRPEHGSPACQEPRQAGERHSETERREIGAQRLSGPDRRISVEAGHEQADRGREPGEDSGGRGESSCDQRAVITSLRSMGDGSDRHRPTTSTRPGPTPTRSRPARSDRPFSPFRYGASARRARLTVPTAVPRAHLQ
jgi:hypothetical protein